MNVFVANVAIFIGTLAYHVYLAYHRRKGGWTMAKQKSRLIRMDDETHIRLKVYAAIKQSTLGATIKLLLDEAELCEKQKSKREVRGE